MKRRPKVSIITVCYKNPQDLEKTIKSVISQTTRDYEYLIVDGAYDDKNSKVVNKYRDNIDYFVSEKDSGVYNAMNKGAVKAYGEYLYFLNAGDVFPNKKTLEDICKHLGRVDMVYGNIRVVKRSGGSFIQRKILSKGNIKLGKKISQQVVFVKRELFNQLGGLDERFKVAADFDLLCKIFEGTGNIKHIDEIICDYDDGGISSNLRKSYDDTAKVIRNRYGNVLYILYMILTRVKLVLKKLIWQVR